MTRLHNIWKREKTKKIVEDYFSKTEEEQEGRKKVLKINKEFSKELEKLKKELRRKAEREKMKEKDFESLFADSVQELSWKYGITPKVINKMSLEERKELVKNLVQFSADEKINKWVENKMIMGGNSLPVSLRKMPESYVYEKGRIAKEALILYKRAMEREGKETKKWNNKSFDLEFRRAVADVSRSKRVEIEEIMKNEKLRKEAELEALKNLGLLKL